MALKNTGSLSKNYVENASKQIPWPVLYGDGVALISVHESELDEAKDNLMVQHLLSNGFAFQYAIEPTKRDNSVKAVFRERIVREKVENSLIGNKYRIIATGCELELIKASSEKDPQCELKYTNRMKPNLPKKASEIERQLKWELWKEIFPGQNLD